MAIALSRLPSQVNLTSRHPADTVQQHHYLRSPTSCCTHAPRPRRNSQGDAAMPLPRPATRLISSPRASLQILTSIGARTSRSFTSTALRKAGDHAHEDHFDPPGGWLFGVKPGEKYENEGWENVWFYGFYGSLLFGIVGYCYKPDTR